jgi:cytochrome oxidase Cu insertion factor (SCO1/SenC/PrrC family)
MRRAMRIALGLFAVAALATVAGVRTANAHRFGGPNDPCERKFGASLVHITLYQPQFDPDAEYCDEVPRAGNTVLVVDTMGEELRRTPIGVAIVARDESGGEWTALEIAPAIYKRGVVDAQVNLDANLRYVIVISIGATVGSNPAQLSFPIRVGAWYRALVVPSILILGLLAFVGISLVRIYRPSLIPALGRGRADARMLAVLAIAISISASACARESKPQSAMLPDVTLTDDHGRAVQLESLKGKVVLIDFIHIGCPGVCDELISKFGQVADSTKPILGSKLILVSVTNDPEHDRPDALLKLATERQADMGGWLFLTGSSADVARVTDAFGVDNRPLPDGSPNHITRVFLLGPDLRQRREYAGMAMDSGSVVSDMMKQIGRGDPS